MRNADLSCARRVAAWASLAGVALVLTACSSSGSTAVASATTSAPVSASPTVTVSSAAPSTDATSAPAAPAASPSPSATLAGPGIFLAESQDINATAWHEPACSSGCVLSGDSTAILDKMTWSAWSATQAVGTGTYKIDACNPSCAAGPVYPVPTVITLSQPVKVCAASGTRWFWSRASFSYPDGLPKALQGTNAPKNPWVFSTVISAAKQSCAS